MPASAEIGWAIMGTETIATEHMVSAIRSIGHLPLWVFSRNLQYAQAFAGDLDVSNATSDLTTVWAAPQVRFVYVSATRDRRPYHVAAAARAGKHILCDGPLCDDREQAAELVKLCHDMKVTLAVHHVARASNVHQTMKRLIRDGDIGQLQSIIVVRGGPHEPPPQRRGKVERAAGDIFFDAAIESVDLARYLTDAEPRQISGLKKVQDQLPLHLAFLMRMNDGCIVQGHESFAVSDIEDMVLVAGSKGSLIANGTLNGRGAGTLTRRIAGKNELMPIRERDVHVAALQDFVAGLHGRPTWLSTGEDSVSNLYTIEALQTSVKTGELVDLHHISATGTGAPS
ncbi:Gfo/Idh/MocA family protein [Rhizobium esperanzae]|uniref:1,5-anhydro-D-fructose reductase (1,5-anhydro-D-mannitol-forming) n=1 Tax=Rhizobium esperanzae TaxID=1967781 RepID=A0A7W6R3T9_9HYPH|nr:Gfo/Idh/MocA family oxidoreductase [Rhizobium esperanzae]MBB4235930.1 1,5-anhydro-D-fructose reductase (1,5-anhydro-D-mannitol-forming) [Rhizobium esperanzae]